MPENVEITECSSLSSQVMDAGKKRGGWTFQKILGYFLQFMSFALLEKLENCVFSYMKFKKYDFR